MPMQASLCAKIAVVMSLSGSLAALAADIEQFHTRLGVTLLTLEEDGVSSSASRVFAISLDMG